MSYTSEQRRILADLIQEVAAGKVEAIRGPGFHGAYNVRGGHLTVRKEPLMTSHGERLKLDLRISGCEVKFTTIIRKEYETIPKVLLKFLEDELEIKPVALGLPVWIASQGIDYVELTLKIGPYDLCIRFFKGSSSANVIVTSQEIPGVTNILKDEVSNQHDVEKLKTELLLFTMTHMCAGK